MTYLTEHNQHDDTPPDPPDGIPTPRQPADREARKTRKARETREEREAREAAERAAFWADVCARMPPMTEEDIYAVAVVLRRLDEQRAAKTRDEQP